MDNPNVQEVIEQYYCQPPLDAGGDSTSTKEDFEITRDELDQITKAFKDDKFRQLLTNYVEEVRNPDNQIIYQSEMTQLERERGNIVHFINPKPGYVLKTSINGETKAFINICSNTLIKKPEFETTVQDNVKGSTWSLPYTQSPARDDLDKVGQKCKVYDVIFNPIALSMASKNKVLQSKLEQTVLDAVENSFKVVIDRVNIKRPKTSYKGPKTPIVVKYKIGATPPSIIDTSVIGKESPPMSDFDKNTVQNEMKPKPEDKKISDTKDKKLKKNMATAGQSDTTTSASKDYSNWTKPKYNLKYRSHVDMQNYTVGTPAKSTVESTTPDELNLIVDLPMLSSSAGLDADVIDNGHGFELISDTKALYYLKIKLPYQVDPDSGKATFDKEKRKLSIVLKVIKKPKPTLKPIYIESEFDEKETLMDNEESFSPKQEPLVSIVTSKAEPDTNIDYTDISC